MSPTEQFRSLLFRGRSRDEALGELRRRGTSPIECIKAIHEVEGASLATAKRLLSESPAWTGVVENTATDFVSELERRDDDLLAILRIGHNTSIRGAGLSLRDALSLTAYRELRPHFGEADLLRQLRNHPALIEEWLVYSEDKRTEGGWYLLPDGTIGQVGRRGEETRFPSVDQAVAAYVVRELDFWANLAPGK
jgi:hypothetical protein